MAVSKPEDAPSKSVINEISPIFGQWCQATTYHGVPDFYRAKNLFLKSMWFVVVITGCFLAFNQILDFILDYTLEDQWATNYYRKAPFDDVMGWPDASICYINPMDAHDWNRNTTSAAEFAFLSSKENGFDFYRSFQADKNESLKTHELRLRAVKNDLSISDSYQNVCQRTILQCGANVGFTGNINCDCSNYAMPSSSRGCFSINLTAIQRGSNKVGAGGYENGVQFLLNPRIHDNHENVLYGDRLTSGLKMYINFEGEDNERFSKPILLGSGTHILISMVTEVRRSVSRSTHTFQFYRSRPECVERFVYQLLDTNHSSRTLCRQDCFTRFTTEHCHCVSRVEAVPLKQYFPVCSEPEEEACQKDMKLARQIKSTLPSHFNLSHCFDGCATPCEYKAVVTEISSAPFPVPKKTRAFTKYLNKAKTRSDVYFAEDEVAQMILVELFFESKEYKVIERETRVSLEELISNIGGTLGVWTGLSLIGIFQAIVYAFFCLRSTLAFYYKKRVMV